MNIYAIYTNPEKKNNNFILIKEGFSWVASFFNIFWMLYHKMWLLLAIVLMTNVLAKVTATALNVQELSLIVKIMIMLIFGFLASDIREYYLRRKNYILKDIILANSETEAELKFLERNLLI